MDSLEGFLRAARVAFSQLTTDNTACICPNCSHTRTKKSDKCCDVRLNDNHELVLWNCKHCGQNGHFRINGLDPHPPRSNGKAQPERTHLYGPRLRKVMWPKGHKPRATWERLENGKWLSKSGPEKIPPLYRLEEIKTAVAGGRQVAVTEGEKDADRLWSLGIVATCSPHGASEPPLSPKWTRKNSEPLRGANVVVFNDNDNPGHAHADATCQCSHGIAASVRRVGDMPQGKDVSDWLDFHGGTLDQLLVLIEHAQPYQPTAATPPPPRTGWLRDCIMSDSKNPVPLSNANNVVLGLRRDDKLKAMLGYDEFALKPMLMHPIGKPSADAVPRELTDADLTDIQLFVQSAGLKVAGIEIVKQAVIRVCLDNSYHPVRDWLDRLEWDGVERVDEWLTTYAGADKSKSDYAKLVGPMFLIQMVARIYQPGCQADYMLVLESPVQGKVKSTMLRTLAEPWFDDDLPHIGDKDAKQHLRGKWLLEVPELDAFNKADATRLKSFLTRREESYRPVWNRLETKEPRQCVFAGTTNERHYLRDHTGNRRVWPVACEHAIDVDSLHRDRDQLFGETVYRYRQGDHWWPDPNTEQATIEPEQASRFEYDPWSETIWEHLLKVKSTTVETICRDVLGIAFERRDLIVGRRIARILQHFKWVPKHTRYGNVWYPAAEPELPV